MGLTEKEKDLQLLNDVTRLLASIADTAETVRDALEHVRYIAAEVNDPALRRLVLSAAAEVKVDASSILPLVPPSKRRPPQRR